MGNLISITASLFLNQPALPLKWDYHNPPNTEMRPLQMSLMLLTAHPWNRSPLWSWNTLALFTLVTPPLYVPSMYQAELKQTKFCREYSLISELLLNLGERSIYELLGRNLGHFSTSFLLIQPLKCPGKEKLNIKHACLQIPPYPAIQMSWN